MKTTMRYAAALAALCLAATLRAQSALDLADFVRRAKESVPAAAADAGPASTMPSGSEIYSPLDFAPSEQVIVGRDPASFRSKGTLLTRATMGIPALDESELYRRRLALYSGERISRHPAFSEEYLAIAEAGARIVRYVAEAGEKPDWTGFWWFVLVVLGLATGILWRKGYLTRDDPAC